jgi:large subunit ribosomal protein L35
MAKTKMKTNRAAAKRFSLTGSGKIKRSHAYRGHLLTAKSSKRKRHLRKATLIAGPDLARTRRLLGGN